MKMIVGLGNIGKKYAHTRHNVGFDVVDRFADQVNASFSKQQCNAWVATSGIGDKKVLLVKPTTYMNESGVAVRALADFYKIETDDILIIHDDMDLPVGHLRLREHGSAGGHNGIKSVIAHLKTKDFKRLRVGIDHPSRQTVVDWVLTQFKGADKQAIDDANSTCCQILDDWANGTEFARLMNQYNHK